MKKLLIGLAAGAIALGASVIPASAGNGPIGSYNGPLPYDSTPGSMWDYIDARNGYGEQLVLMAGLSNTLDVCGNGKTLYTLFLPLESVLTLAVDEVFDTTIADLAESPAVVKALLSDHLVAGAVDPGLLTSQDGGVKKLVAVSGYVINIRMLNTITYPVYGSITQFWSDWYANGQQLINATVTCNGWIYDMFGVFQPEDYAETFGTNNLPPTGSAVSELPDTL